jgi:uncharacterized oxidoreductase
MKHVDPERLRDVVREIISAAGSHGDEPDRVADNLVDANLTGHDSHGVGMLPAYMESLHAGELKPNQHAEIVSEQGGIVVIDGHQGYGQVVGAEAMAIGIERARDFGVCVLAIRNSFHLCRIGAWGEACAAAGLVSMHHVNGYGNRALVAPHRGTDARLMTNPYCCALPATNENPPFIADFATSIVAMGKVRMAKNAGVAMADGILFDSAGAPTNDPAAMYADPPGAIMPVGEHKGYCMAMVNELLAGALTGGGTWPSQPKQPRRAIFNNMLSIIIDPGRLVDGTTFASEVDATLAHVRASPPQDADKPVLVPGEPERLMHEHRSAHGIPIDAESWREIIAAAQSVDVAPTRLEALVANGARH